jgi:hypothetical protein
MARRACLTGLAKTTPKQCSVAAHVWGCFWKHLKATGRTTFDKRRWCGPALIGAPPRPGPRRVLHTVRPGMLCIPEYRRGVLLKSINNKTLPYNIRRNLGLFFNFKSSGFKNRTGRYRSST